MGCSILTGVRALCAFTALLGGLSPSPGQSFPFHPACASPSGPGTVSMGEEGEELVQREKAKRTKMSTPALDVSVNNLKTI